MKKFVILFVLTFTASAALNAQDAGPLTKLSKEDVEILIEDDNPSSKKELAKDLVKYKEGIKALRLLLAIANQARKDGFADTLEAKFMLDALGKQTLAREYSKKKNNENSDIEPESLITKEQIDAFYQDEKNEAGFRAYLRQKTEIAREKGVLTNKDEYSPDEAHLDRDGYARISIYNKEAREGMALLGGEFERRVRIKTHWKQVEYLAFKYADYLRPKVQATDEEIADFLAKRPELSTAAKKAKAESLLKRIKAGANFAVLADLFSDDPGTKGKGGLYRGITPGQFVPEFEQAVMALKPGQVANFVVETKYGFHIIKLERRGKGTDAEGKPVETFDTRHILVSTTVKTGSESGSPEVPLMDYAVAQVEKTKGEKLFAEIIANNPVEIAGDFVITVPPGTPSEPVVPPRGDDAPPIVKPEVKTKPKAPIKMPVVKRRRG